MLDHPLDPIEAKVAGDDGDNARADAADIIRRLNDLWQSQSEVLAGPLASFAGSAVGRYRLERIIGRGAFGIVYKAHDPDLNRAVAIKIPRPDVLLDSDRLARFESEVQACARLDHPGIVPLYEADLSRAVPYMASAYCPGPNLQQWMDEFGVSCEIDSAVRLIEKVAGAVQYAHEHGVVHRDLKPGNIILVPIEANSSALNTLDDYQPRLTDFGLAQITHGMHESQSSLIIGTPLYMSPEQAESRSDEVGSGSDVFGLGAVLYHLLTGVTPFAASNYAAVLLRLREENPVPISTLRAGVDADLETVCMKCLQRNPVDRYASAAMFADDLRRCLNRQPILGRRMTFIQRVRRWSQQTARVNEASLLIIVLACIRMIFGPGSLLIVMATPDVPFTSTEIIEAFIVDFLVTWPIDLWIIWSARRHLLHRSRHYLYWLSFGCVVLLSVNTLLIGYGILPSMQWYKQATGARTLVFSFISLTFFFQSLCWYIADLERFKNGPVSASRRNAKRLLVCIPLLVGVAVPLARYVCHSNL